MSAPVLAIFCAANRGGMMIKVKTLTGRNSLANSTDSIAGTCRHLLAVSFCCLAGSALLVAPTPVLAAPATVKLES